MRAGQVASTVCPWEAARADYVSGCSGGVTLHLAAQVGRRLACHRVHLQVIALLRAQQETQGLEGHKVESQKPEARRQPEKTPGSQPHSWPPFSEVRI